MYVHKPHVLANTDGHFSVLFFMTKNANDIKMNLCPNMCISMAVIWKSFLSLHDLKNQLFEANKRFECIFYRVEVEVIKNPSSRLAKTPNT